MVGSGTFCANLAGLSQLVGLTLQAAKLAALGKGPGIWPIIWLFIACLFYTANCKSNPMDGSILSHWIVST